MSDKVNPGAPGIASIRDVSIGCRYPEDRVDLLDAITKRLGMRNRSEVIRMALDEMVERHFGRAA